MTVIFTEASNKNWGRERKIGVLAFCVLEVPRDSPSLYLSQPLWPPSWKTKIWSTKISSSDLKVFVFKSDAAKVSKLKFGWEVVQCPLVYRMGFNGMHLSTQDPKVLNGNVSSQIPLKMLCVYCIPILLSTIIPKFHLVFPPKKIVSHLSLNPISLTSPDENNL